MKRTPREFAFLHRSFQDYLSAFHLSRFPFADQWDITEAHCTDPQWREVLLGLLHLTQRPDEVGRLLMRVRGKVVAHSEKYAVGSLLTEASTGNFNCPSQLAKELCQLAIDEIEMGTWLPHREHLLRTVLGGLTSVNVRNLLVRSIPTWFPDRGYWVNSVLKAMGTWPRTPEVISCLFRALHNEYKYHPGAIQALTTIARDDDSVADRLLCLASGSASVNTRSAAMEALLSANPDHDGWPKLASEMNASPSSEFRALCIRWKIHRGLQTQDDLRFLLTSAAAPLFHPSEVSASTLVRGWPQDQTIRALAIRSVVEAPHGYLDRDLSILLLIEGFPNDDDVRRTVADMIRQDKSGTLGFQNWSIWKALAVNYKGDPEIVAAIDDWLSKADHSWEPTAAFAVLVGRTPLGKRKLLESVSTSSIPQWAADALLEGWGLQDPEVSSILRVTADSPRAVRIAALLPRIIDDRERCYERLIALLSEPGCERPDFVVSGLVQLGTDHQNDVIKAALPFVDNSRMFGDSVAGILMEHFARDPQIRELALKQLNDRDGNIAAVAEAFGHDTVIRQKLIALAVPLPTPLRAVIIDFLGLNARQNGFCLDLLRLYDYERDPSLKVRAAIEYYSAISRGGSLDDSLDDLSTTLICSGPDFQERQQAAFVGLDILGRLDLMLDAASKYGDNRVAINLGGSFSTNAPLVRHILSRWELIKAALGNRFPSILSRFDDPWRHFFAFADEYDAVREGAIDYVRASGGTPSSVEMLDFVGRVQPKSKLLLDCCIACIRGRAVGWDLVHKSVELLGRDFSGDDDALQTLLAGSKPDWLPLPMLLALCEGWPWSQRLADECKRLVRHRVELPGELRRALRCARGTPRQVLRELTKILRWAYVRDFRMVSDRLARPLVKRIGTDQQLQQTLLTKLTTTATSLGEHPKPAIHDHLKTGHR